VRPSGRIRVGVLVGGASSEREISLASGKMIADHLPRDGYEVVLLDTLALMVHHPSLSGVLRERARALLVGASRQSVLEDRDRALPGIFQEQIRTAALATLPATQALIPQEGRPGIDVAFVALHGPFGEDGTVQGLLELLGIPYVGSGVLASALAMDKVVSKKLFTFEGIPTPRGVVLERVDFRADRRSVLERALRVMPAVVKPARQGSSIGMSLVREPAAMDGALEEAFGYDAEALVEEQVLGTELTVGILGNRELRALPVVEIVAKRDFFDYRAKYDPDLSQEICPARIPAAVSAEAQALALKAHRALGCRGFSRVDMIHGKEGLVVLELNTIPGMTVNSLLPKAAKVAGLSFSELLERLVELALEPEA
jgi:D-alanine-D-alanine ligase